MHNASHLPPDQIQDVVIVGAGVVGCAIARECALRGMRTLVLEKATDFLDGASKANSAILHTGFDAPTDSLEQRCIATGYRRYFELAPKFDLGVERTGALVTAWNDGDTEALPGIRDKAIGNGVKDARLLTANQLRNVCPGLSDQALAALHVPGESIIDPWSTPWAYLRQAMAHGAILSRNCEMLGGNLEGAVWRIRTSRGEIRAKLVINCAGLYGDRVEAALTGAAGFTIKPRKGQFVVYDKAARAHCETIILPVPSAHTKGVVVCPTVFGNVLVGPTAEEQESREEAAVDEETLKTLKQRGREILPALDEMPVTAIYAGLRPATERPEYRLSADSARQYIRVGGIRSTGLSAALGIAAWVDDAINGLDGDWPKHSSRDLHWPRTPVLCENKQRDWQQSGNGGIVCHCEWVTRREVEVALNGPLGATSLAGLKRRTRVTMGRCQGFYCSARLSELTVGYIEPPIAK